MYFAIHMHRGTPTIYETDLAGQNAHKTPGAAVYEAPSATPLIAVYAFEGLRLRDATADAICEIIGDAAHHHADEAENADDLSWMIDAQLTALGLSVAAERSLGLKELAAQIDAAARECFEPPSGCWTDEHRLIKPQVL